MQKIIEQQAVESVSKISKILENLGFNLQLLSSERYVEQKLEALAPDKIELLKNTLSKSNHSTTQKRVCLCQAHAIRKN